MLDIRRMDRVPNTQIRELCGVTDGVEKRIDEDVLRWFSSHVERMENDSFATKVYVGGYAGSCSVAKEMD